MTYHYIKHVMHKFNAELKHETLKKDYTTYYFNLEGRIIGEQNNTEATNLLKRASNKIENLLEKKLLHSTLLGNLSFSKL